jgi:uroporphyrinogen III methyltransferase/synthase
MSFSSPKKGIVYLVGAGPGHPGLITRWGYELLQKCDAVAYDALIPMELISGLPETVERYYVGKRARRHSVPQPQINELLATLAKRGLNVVRLKGGDPFVFGRIGEEARYLSDAGVPVVMVPGVTAASAAAAMGGFSLTSRQESSWVFIATGHPAENSSTPVPWEKVASLPGGTLVIYMGIARIESIVQQLLESGMPPETPAVVVHAASTGMQKSVQAPLKEICAESLRRGLKPPALVIIGEPVRCQTDNYGISHFLLTGKRVLLTGSHRETEEMAARLRDSGAEPIPYPTVRNRTFKDDAGWERFRKTLETGAACLLRKGMDVGYFFDALEARGMDGRDLARVRMIALGAPVAEAMRLRGILADATIADILPETVAKSIPASAAGARLTLLYPRSTGETTPPEESYMDSCRGIVSLVVREEATAEWDARWKEELASAPPDFIIFSGEPEVRGFLEILGTDAAAAMARQSRIAATDRSIAETLQKNGLPCAILLCGSGDGKLVEALAEYSKY